MFRVLIAAVFVCLATAIGADRTQTARRRTKTGGGTSRRATRITGLPGTAITTASPASPDRTVRSRWLHPTGIATGPHHRGRLSHDHGGAELFPADCWAGVHSSDSGGRLAVGHHPASA